MNKLNYIDIEKVIQDHIFSITFLLANKHPETGDSYVSCTLLTFELAFSGKGRLHRLQHMLSQSNIDTDRLASLFLYGIIKCHENSYSLCG
jgi:hypothetical protein